MIDKLLFLFSGNRVIFGVIRSASFIPGASDLSTSATTFAHQKNQQEYWSQSYEDEYNVNIQESLLTPRHELFFFLQ